MVENNIGIEDLLFLHQALSKCSSYVESELFKNEGEKLVIFIAASPGVLDYESFENVFVFQTDQGLIPSPEREILVNKGCDVFL